MNLNKKIAIQTQDIILNDKEFNQKYVFPSNRMPYPLPKRYGAIIREGRELKIYYKEDDTEKVGYKKLPLETITPLTEKNIITKLELNSHIDHLIEKPITGISYQLFEPEVNLKQNYIERVCNQLDAMIAGLPEDLQKTFGKKNELLIHELTRPLESSDIMTDTKQRGGIQKKSKNNS